MILFGTNHLLSKLLRILKACLELGSDFFSKSSKEFSIFYSDHFLLSSLNGNSIYLIKFNNNYEKILTLEKIFIGFRIRDLDYLQNDNLILMALEEKGQLGIIKKNF